MELLIGFLVFVISTYIFFYRYPKKYPPGPMPYPFVGNSPLIRKLSKKYNGIPFALIELCKLYKTDVLSLKMGREYTVVVQTEDLINKVLMSDEFQSRPNNFFAQLRCMGKRLGITMTDGPFWLQQRTFAFKHLHNLGFGRRRMEEMIQMQLEEMLSTLGTKDFNSLKFRRILSKCILNVLWEIATGQKFKSNDQDLEDLQILLDRRNKALDVMGGILNQFPILRFICPEWCGYNLIQRLNNKFKNLIMKVIDEHKKTYSPNETRDFIDAFLHEMYKNEPSSTFTEEQLVMVTLDFFIAGAKTTGTALDFLLLHMVLNPHIQEKVHQELDGVFKPGDVPNLQDKFKCPYVEAVILESHRLTFVTPLMGPRRTLRDTTLDGYFIPKETTILLNLMELNKNPEKWNNPEEMRPERFIGENGKVIASHDLFTFGKGLRRCPGEALAKSCLFIFFSGILLNYNLQVLEKADPPALKVDPGILSSPAEYSFRMVKRFS